MIIRQEDRVPEEGFVSKSQKKREMDALQGLGKELVELPADTLKTLPLPDDLREAIKEYRRLKAHGAIRRQLQFIGRIMRHVDPEPIEARLAILRGDSTQHTAWLHRLERYRDNLVAEDGAMDAFVREYPLVDVQALRPLIRNARREHAAGKPPKSYRAVFQLLKTLLPEPGSAPAPVAAEDTLLEDDDA